MYARNSFDVQFVSSVKYKYVFKNTEHYPVCVLCACVHMHESTRYNINGDYYKQVFKLQSMLYALHDYGGKLVNRLPVIPRILCWFVSKALYT